MIPHSFFGIKLTVFFREARVENDVVIAYLPMQLENLIRAKMRIGLIGSFARGEQDESSDIDLLIEFEPGTADIYDKKTKLKQLLVSSFHRDIDLCREKYVKPYIKEYLLRDVIYV